MKKKYEIEMTDAINVNLCIFFCCFFALFSPIFSSGVFDTITPTQPLNFNQTIVSSGEMFELGFFCPREPTKCFVGVWYRRIIQPRTYVWVANRDNPLVNSPGSLTIGENGNLVLLDQDGVTVWKSNQSKAANSVAQLLDSGNFVVRPENSVDSGNYLWQSFDHPADTLLPGMKLGWDAKTGMNRYLTSWKSMDDPSSGDYTFKLETKGFPEIFLRNGDVRIYRSGPWNGLRFSGVPEMKSSPTFSFEFKMEKFEVYYTFHLNDQLLYSRLQTNPQGNLQRFTWIDSSKQWSLFWFAPKDQCDHFTECGPFGVCDSNASPVCKCMPGFGPKNPAAWNLRDGSGGCVRKTKLNCRNDGFKQLNNMKLPDSTTSFIDKTMELSYCREMCQKNCSCTAYGASNISNGGSGCVIWTVDLLDMRQYAVEEGGQDLFVKLAASDLDSEDEGYRNDSRKSKQILMITGISVAAVIMLSGICLFVLWKRKALQKALRNKIEHKGCQERSQDFLLNEAVILSKRDYSGEATTDDLELPLFDFSTIAMATNNFFDANKLGQGGFGCVYKGILADDQEIAVKRLSKNSGQGIEEFKNEVRLIARLQHRNLVRLLGCSVDMEEKMLIYEYMENKSLDSILFNKEKRSLLDWHRRFNIICGIARGLLYLHQDSRFRIIHRDLKASNILLDKEMNPKISDFGMARIFGSDQTEANTRRVVGTYGYMAPEYAMDGLFSVKSDAFSFGVLVLEIITGIKNRGFYYTNNELNLLGHAWMLWKEGRGLELMDSSAGDSYSPDEVMRCIQVGLLCVQEKAEDRPTMSAVVLMLSSETAPPAQPKSPGFCLGRKPSEVDSSSSKQDEFCTVNQVTVTIIDGR